MIWPTHGESLRQLEMNAGRIMAALIERGGTHDKEVLARSAVDHALQIQLEMNQRSREARA